MTASGLFVGFSRIAHSGGECRTSRSADRAAGECGRAAHRPRRDPVYQRRARSAPAWSARCGWTCHGGPAADGYRAMDHADTHLPAQDASPSTLRAGGGPRCGRRHRPERCERSSARLRLCDGRHQGQRGSRRRIGRPERRTGRSPVGGRLAQGRGQRRRGCRRSRPHERG